MVSSKLFQSPQKETIIGFEHMGGIFGQLLMAYRPWTTGIKDKLENTKYAVVQLGQRLQRVIPPISTDLRSRTFMQPWPDAALG
jgi:hypothetical protein